MSSPPRVYISYSHDSEEHDLRVLDLTQRLRQEGVDCRIDRFDEVKAEGLHRWMMNQFDWADHVVLVCTQHYYEQFLGRTPGTVKFESDLVLDHLLDNAENHKFVSAGFVPADRNHFLPPILRRWRYFDVATEKGYDDLYFRLTRQPKVTPEPLGPMRATASVFMVPYPRNVFFTGRDEELDRLHEALAGTGVSAVTQAIQGLGGLGKTQLAVEYAFRHKQDYSAILWVQADTRDNLQSGFVEIARKLDLPEKDEAEQSKVVEAVRNWLETEPEYLLILDNADDPDSLQDLLPNNPSGRILVTTRAHALDSLRILVPISLDTLPEDDALAFFLKRTSRTQIGEEEQLSAREVVQALGCLPLALEQAGAYLARNPLLKFADYLTLFRKLRLDLLQRQGPVQGRYKETVRTTWLANIEAALQENCAVDDLLKACAYLNPERIPAEIFLIGGDQLGSLRSAALQPTGDIGVLSEMLQVLARYSLLSVTTEEQTFSIHRLVQEVVRELLTKPEQKQWVERVLAAVAYAYPGSDYTDWPACERLRPHWLVCSEQIDRLGVESEEAGWLLNQAGYYLSERAVYPEALSLFQRAVIICENVRGNEHPDTATSLNNLALLYYRQGRYEEAEPVFEQAFAIFQKVMGSEHPTVAASLNNLAALYKQQGHYEKATPLYCRALAIHEKVLGSEHPLTLTCLNNLAALYQEQARYDEAQHMYEQALSIRDRVLGSEHPDVAQSLNNLAGLYAILRRDREAEDLHLRALSIRKTVHRKRTSTYGPKPKQSGNTLQSTG